VRILLIDDDALVLGAITNVLEFDGHEVVTARGGQAGIDAFETSLDGSPPFDVVITDLGMPRVDGYLVASTIKKDSPKTPIILLTGAGEAPFGSNHAGVDLVVGKPIRARELRDVLAKYAPTPGRN
jgi:CheY-like chemotaxis protein